MAKNEADRQGWRRSRWRKAPWIAAMVILVLPAIAMQFTDEVAWDAQDFLVMGVMLIAACSAFELVARRSTNVMARTIAGTATGIVFLLIWLQLAVGLI